MMTPEAYAEDPNAVPPEETPIDDEGLNTAPVDDRIALGQAVVLDILRKL